MDGATPAQATPETRLFTLMGEIGARAGELLKALAGLKEAVEKAGDDALPAAIANAEHALGDADVDQSRETLRALLGADADLSHYTKDATAAVAGILTLRRHWPSQAALASGAVLAAVQTSERILRDVVFHCTKVTIRRDITWELESTHVGKVLDFNAAFGSELQDKVERTRILDYLKHRKFGGWVDVANGKIYKLPPAAWLRFLACIAPFVTAALAAGALFAFSLFDVSGFTDGEQLLLIFCLVLGGALAQLSVETVKQSLSETVPILALSDGIAWLSLRWLGLVKTVFVALGVVVGLRLAGTEPGGQGLTICIAAGYSLDSVAGIFLTRFDSVASEGAVAVRTLLAPDGTPADRDSRQPDGTA
jgi:hypothetical protein